MSKPLPMQQPSQEDEVVRPPIDFHTIEGERPLLDKHTYKMASGTDTKLRTMKPDGPPKRLFWDTDAKLSTYVAKGLRMGEFQACSFKLTTAKLPKLEEKGLILKSDQQSLTGSIGGAAAAEVSSSSAAADLASLDGFLAGDMSPKGSVGKASHGSAAPGYASLKTGIGADGKPLKRAEKYFQLLMKAHNRRESDNRKTEYDEEWARCEGAAKLAFDKIIAAEQGVPEKAAASDVSSEHGSDSESDEEEVPDYGDLTCYDGQMQIEIEFTVIKAPGEETPPPSEYGDEESEAGKTESGGGETSRTASTPPIDFTDELEALKAEMKGHTDSKDGDQDGDDGDGIPEGLRGQKKMPNLWDNPFPEWTLDLGGSVFFVPDAERYAHCPSLPPPPPPSLLGRRRIRLKPRLPLDISNHRYPDEHPNIWPEAPFSPEQEHYLSFEQKMMTFDLYRAACDALPKMPQQEREKQGPKHRYLFGRHVENALWRSQAWKNWRHREKIRKQKERAAEEARQAEERRKQEEKEAKLKAAAEALEADDDDD